MNLPISQTHVFYLMGDRLRCTLMDCALYFINVGGVDG